MTRIRGLLALLLLPCACSGGGELADDAGGGLSGEGALPVLDGTPDTGDPRCPPGAALLARVQPARMLKDLTFLVGLGERRSHEGQSQAAAYLKAELEELPGLALREQPYTYQGQSYVNLEASIQGSELPEEHVFAGAHYDSASSDPTLAPGADDNASGTATVLELARALSGCRPRRSVRLLLFSNEEVGTIGSKSYVASIKSTLPEDKLLGFFSVDMVAYGPAGEDLDLATRPAYQGFVDEAAAAVEKHTTLKTKKIVSDHCG